MGQRTSAMGQADQLAGAHQPKEVPAIIADAMGMAARGRTPTTNPDKSPRARAAAPAPGAAADQSAVLRAAAATRAERRAQARRALAGAQDAASKDDAAYEAIYGPDATTARPQADVEPAANDELYQKAWPT